MTRIRLFIAIDLPSNIKEELMNLRLGIPGAKWVDEEQLHLTLRFIGETKRDEFDQIKGLLSEIKMPAFELTLQEVGVFKSRQTPRVLWVGIKKNTELVGLRNKIERKLQKWGWPAEERKFFPHITLARFNLKGSLVGNNNKINNKNNLSGASQLSSFYRVGNFLECFNLYKSEPFLVNSFHLYSSYISNKSVKNTKEFSGIEFAINGGAGSVGPIYRIEASYELS